MSYGQRSTPPNDSKHSRDNDEEAASPPLQPFPEEIDRSPSSERVSRSDVRTERRGRGEEPSPLNVTYDDESGTKRIRSADRPSSTIRTTSSATTTALTNRPHRRFDLGDNAQHHRTVHIDQPNILDPNETAGDEAEGGLFIWGTRIRVQDVQIKFRRMLETFIPETVADDENAINLPSNERQMIDISSPYYMERLKEVYMSEELYLNVNLQHVKDFDDPLYRKIVCYPADVIPYLDVTVNELFAEVYNRQLSSAIEIRPFNAEKTRNMRALNPEDIDQLITITGMVTRTSPPIPEMRSGYFECLRCHRHVESEVDRGRIEEPIVCTNCQSAGCFQLIHNRSQFMDKQIVKLQESPDDMPAGQTPHTVTLYVHGNLVESVQPGDRVTVSGIYRAQPLRVNPRMRTVRAVYKTHVDVLHFRRNDLNRLHQQDDGTYLTEERINQILELSKNPDIADRLASALAPSIYEHDDVKKGILCLLFGGTRKEATWNRGGGRAPSYRSEINVLLCGDPGTAKSQILQYVFNLVPRTQYTSGKGTSAVGLTAAVSRDPETKHFILQTGALVLSDNGVCCIDEFDKMNESTRSVLHEVMEQQTLSIAKAGIICQLNARTSILAAANPADSQWNRNKTIVENVQLPHTLLSRFDLIFLLVDPQCEYYDRRLATHLVSLYHKSNEEENVELLDMSLMRDYVSYAKKNIHPKLSEEASQMLIDKYISMRKIGSGRGQVTAYPRQLESLVRLSEACAKIRLSQIVTIDDVEEAHRLHCEALKQSAVDPATGKVDVNILAAGMSSSARKLVAELAEAIKGKLKTVSASYPLSNILRDVRQTSDRSVSKEMFDEAINDLLQNDVIICTGNKVRLNPRTVDS